MINKEKGPLSGLLAGTKVRLTDIVEEDYEKLAEWYGDTYSLRCFEIGPAFPYNTARVKKWIEEQVSSGNHFSFAIRAIEGNLLVGYVDLNNILWSNRVATLSIALGDKNSRGKGYATDAMSLLLKFAFHELNLHRVQLSVISYNEAAIALYERSGFQREGCQRELIERDGRRHDLYNYGLLRREWEERMDFRK